MMIDRLETCRARSDTLDDGRRCRILVIVDDCTRECLARVVNAAPSGQRVTRELARIIKARASR